MFIVLFSVLLFTLVGFAATMMLLYPQRRQSFIRLFYLLQMIYFVWALTALFLIVTPIESVKVAMLHARFLVIPFAIPIWFILISGVFQRKVFEKTKPFFPLFFIVPVFFVVTAFLNLIQIPAPWASSFINNIQPLVVDGNINTLKFSTGTLFNYYLLYSYITLSTVFALAAKTCINGPRHMRKAAYAFILGGLIHIASDTLALALYPQIRFLQITIASTVPLLVTSYWVITRNDMFTLKALARDKILNEMPLPTLAFSPLGELWDFNQMAAQILHLHRRDLGLTLEQLQDKTQLNFSVSQLKLHGRVYQVHKRYMTLQQDLEPALIYSFSDITEIRALSLELSHQNERLQNLNQELSRAVEFNHQVSSVLSHDLSGSLSSVNMMIESLMYKAGQRGDTELQRALELTLKSQQSALDLLSDLLRWNLHKGESLNYNNLRSPSECLDRVISHLTAQTSSKKVSFSIADHTTQEAGYISSQLFETVLRNIISNSIRHSHTGSEVKIRLENNTQGLRVEIVDQGLGIPSETLERLNADKPDLKPSDEGFGVGLFFTRRFVKEMGGSFSMTSENQMGTQVVVELPLHSKGAT